ncbi:MAG: hypothetical protein DI611_03895 [Brachybacterium faecium]|nr:MAG: hypothetical protein DI611_03895 [Brachybacterium faecium]
MCASRDVAVATIRALRGEDFESTALETVVRAVDRTIRSGARHTPENVTRTAVEHGLIRERHQVEFERLLRDLADDCMGEPGTWQMYRLIFRSALRSLLMVSERAEQVRGTYDLEDGWWFGHDGFDCGGRAITAAPDVADMLETLSGQLTAAASRLRTEVAPR